MSFGFDSFVVKVNVGRFCMDTRKLCFLLNVLDGRTSSVAYFVRQYIKHYRALALLIVAQNLVRFCFRTFQGGCASHPSKTFLFK